MSDIDWKAIRAEYEAGGISLRQLAMKYGVSKTYLIERRDKESWNRPDRPPIYRPLTTTQAVTPPISTHEKGPMTDVQRAAAQYTFLEAYAQQANIMVAAKAAGVHRTTVYDWLEKDEDFSLAYNQAKEAAKDMIRAEIFRRGHDGWEEPVYQMGIYAGKLRKYSDTLLIFHAKMLMPEYRDKSTVDVNANVSGTIEHVRKLHALTDEELEALERLAMKARGEHGS